MATKVIKRKRVSKKSKLSWRKHTDINDVEDFLEDQRLEELLGQPLETLSNDDILKIDTELPDAEIGKQKCSVILKPLKCFSALEPYTQVQDPIKKRNRVRSKEERKNELIKKKEAENRAKGIFKHKELQAIIDHKVNELKNEFRPKRGQFIKDIWDDEEDKTNIHKNEWITEDTKKHNLAGTGKVRKFVKSPVKPKSSILPSVEAPHPGISYNPSYQDHQDLLKTIAEKEMKIIKEEQHLNRVTRDMFSKVTVDKKDALWLTEMSQGLIKEEDDNAEKIDNEYRSVNPPVANKKKTSQQRRKQKEQLKLELIRKTAKLEKKKVTDINQLRILNKQIEKKEVKSKIIREKRQKIKAIKEKDPKRLSSMKFEEADLEFNMVADLSGNLRNIKREGNLLYDRFKSLQKRNIVEPSIRRHKKKAKVKVYTKPGHKDDWIKTVAR